MQGHEGHRPTPGMLPVARQALRCVQGLLGMCVGSQVYAGTLGYLNGSSGMCWDHSVYMGSGSGVCVGALWCMCVALGCVWGAGFRYSQGPADVCVCLWTLRLYVWSLGCVHRGLLVYV